MADISQTLIVPRFVKFHDGGGKAFLAGLAPGWNGRVQIGRGDAGKGASWSPFPEDK